MFFKEWKFLSIIKTGIYDQHLIYAYRSIFSLSLVI